MSGPRRVLELEALELEVGINPEGKGFLHIRATATDNDGPLVLYGQLDPALATEQGLNFLAGAEAATQDAGLFAFARQMEAESGGDPDSEETLKKAATLVRAVRDYRARQL